MVTKSQYHSGHVLLLLTWQLLLSGLVSRGNMATTPVRWFYQEGGTLFLDYYYYYKTWESVTCFFLKVDSLWKERTDH